MRHITGLPPGHTPRIGGRLDRASGAQLLLGYWFYTYLIWFYPLLLVAVIQPAREHRDAKAPANSTGRTGVPREDQMLLAAASNR